MSISAHPKAALPNAVDHDVPLRWTAFIYRLPGTNGRARTALWRLLNGLGALNLGQGTWAVPQSGDDDLELVQAIEHVHAAGGEAWARPVGGDDDGDHRLQMRLRDACERMWDAFFNDLDRVAYQATVDPQTAAGALTVLREHYSRVLARDLLISPAASRAERRLADLAESIGAATVECVEEAAPGGHRIRTTSVVHLSEEVVRIVMQVQPVATASWERAFNEFEQFAYAHNPDRVPLRHNTFMIVTTPDQREAVRVAVQERITRFEAYLTP